MRPACYLLDTDLQHPEQFKTVFGDLLVYLELFINAAVPDLLCVFSPELEDVRLQLPQSVFQELILILQAIVFV